MLFATGVRVQVGEQQAPAVLCGLGGQGFGGGGILDVECQVVQPGSAAVVPVDSIPYTERG